MAAQAVMYLPVYVAQEKGIFSTLLPDTKVNLIPANGDYDAIIKMNDDNVSVDANTFAIAIADPNAIKDVDDARVIGSLIDRLSFWGVSKKKIDCHKKGINKSVFNKVVHYDENLITGYKIGIAVRNKENINDCRTINKLGEEFAQIEEQTIVISPDLLTIANLCVNEEAYINYHFANADRYMPNTYITTAIMTSKWCLQKEFDESLKLVNVIEAIQKAKSIIYSSKQIAKEILINMDCMKSISEDKKDDVADFIIQIINNDRIYPSDLNISKEQWESTNTNSGEPFSDYVYNEIVLRAEKKIADQFGITFDDTFADRLSEIKKQNNEEIDSYKATIQKQEGTITELEKKLNKYQNDHLRKFINWCMDNWLLLICSIYTIVWIVFRFITYSEWSESPFAKLCATAITIPIIINIVTSVRKRISK